MTVGRIPVYLAATLVALFFAVPADAQKRATTRISVASSGLEGNSGSYYPSISADGRTVAFDSYASNLVSGDTNGYWDVFMHARGHPTGIANQGGDKQEPKVSIIGTPTIVNAPQTGNSTMYVNTRRPHLGLAGVTRARIRERLFETTNDEILPN